MAVSQAANLVERIIGHDDNASITTDISNYNETGMETGDKILATTWQGKNQVKLGKYIHIYPSRLNNFTHASNQYTCQNH